MTSIYQQPLHSHQNKSGSRVPFSEATPSGVFAFSSTEELYGRYDNSMPTSYTPRGRIRRTDHVPDEAIR
jgi:hypothetical protein